MSEENSNKIKIFNFIFTLLIVVYHLRGIYSFNIQYNNAFDEKILKSFSLSVRAIASPIPRVEPVISAFLLCIIFITFLNYNNEK